MAHLLVAACVGEEGGQGPYWEGRSGTGSSTGTNNDP